MYLTVKFIHVTAAILTISGFTLRGIWMLTGSALLDRKPVKILPHVIDTVFLVTGISLIWILRLPVMSQTWLLVKLAAIVVYILLGMVALRPGRSQRVRAIAFALAVTTFIYVAGVAYNKSEFSWLAAGLF